MSLPDPTLGGILGPLPALGSGEQPRCRDVFVELPPLVDGQAPAPPQMATLGSRCFPEATACTHCAAPVRVENYTLGPKVEHYDPDASFRDSVWWHCRLTVATLPDAPPVDA